MDITERWYRSFAEHTAPTSPSYRALSLLVAGDGELLERLRALPEPKRQPNLLFGATRYLSGPVTSTSDWREWALSHWDELAAVILAHRTQTNETNRCAALLPLLAQIEGPIALLEVGASAGLNLYPDRYRYRYGSHELGDGPVLLDCEPRGEVPLPTRLPEIVWRAGLDLNPLDIRDDEVLRWLTALVWPEHDERRARLLAAAEIVRADPPRLVLGDMLTDLRALAGEAPDGATLVVQHSAALAYVLDPEARKGFAATVTSLPGHWIALESPGVVPGTEIEVDVNTEVVSMDGRVMGFSDSHGRWIGWA